MGYWSCHPMCGDTPMDYEHLIADFAVECLTSEIRAEAISEDEKFNIPESLRTWFAGLDECHTYDDVVNSYWEYEEEHPIPYKDLYTHYRYDIINHFLSEEGSFVVPFTFIKYGIDVKKDYVKYLVEMLGDGDASERGYGSWKGEKDHPMYYIELVKKYSEALFNEENKDLDSKEFAEQHKDDLMEIEPKGLFEVMFEKLEDISSGTVNVD